MTQNNLLTNRIITIPSLAKQQAVIAEYWDCIHLYGYDKAIPILRERENGMLLALEENGEVWKPNEQ